MANLRTLNRMLLNGLCFHLLQWTLPVVPLKAIAQALRRSSRAITLGILALGLSAIVCLSGPQPILAEEINAPAQSLVDSADIPSEKIDHFAQAYLQVLQLLSDREPELPAAETSAEAAKIQQSIEADAIKIIERNELTLPEYMDILSLASQDEAFQDKVLGRMDESTEDAYKG